MFRHLARRNNSGSIATLRVSYGQQNLPLCHPEDYEALLSIFFSIVNAPDSERVIEYCLGKLKTHSMSFEVRLRLGGVPFKLQSLNLMILRETSSTVWISSYLRDFFNAGFKSMVRISLCR